MDQRFSTAEPPVSGNQSPYLHRAMEHSSPNFCSKSRCLFGRAHVWELRCCPLADLAVLTPRKGWVL